MTPNTDTFYAVYCLLKMDSSNLTLMITIMLQNKTKRGCLYFLKILHGELILIGTGADCKVAMVLVNVCEVNF